MDTTKPNDLSIGKDLDDEPVTTRQSGYSNAGPASPRSGPVSGGATPGFGGNHQTGRVRGFTAASASASAGSPFHRIGAGVPGANAMTPGQARGTPGAAALGGRGMPLASPRSITSSMGTIGGFRGAPAATPRLKATGTLTRPASSSFSNPGGLPNAYPATGSASPSISSRLAESAPAPAPTPVPAPLFSQSGGSEDFRLDDVPSESSLPTHISEADNENESKADVPQTLASIPDRTPSVPDQVPSIPDLPIVPSIPDFPVTSSLAHTSDEPSIPDVPAVPSVPDLPMVPSIPDIPIAVSIPDLPSVPEPSIQIASTDSQEEEKVQQKEAQAEAIPDAMTVETSISSPVVSDTVSAADKPSVTISNAISNTTSSVPAPAAAVVPVVVIPPRTLDSESKKLPLAWSEETPQFWAQVQQAQAQNFTSIKQMEAVISSLTGVARTSALLDNSAIRDYSALLDGVTKDPFVGTALKALSQFGSLSSELADQFDLALAREKKALELQTETQAKTDEYERLSATYADKIKRYLALKTTTDAKKLQEKSFKLANLQHQLEMARYAQFSSLYQLNETLAYNVMSPLVLRTNALWNYFKSGYEIMRKMEPELDMVAAMVRKQTCRADEIRAECRKQSELVERFASEQQRVMSASSTHTESSLMALTNALGVTTANSQAGVRDLDPRRANKELGFVKRGYLYTPTSPPTRVWVELDRETLSVYGGVAGKDTQSQPQRLPVVLCTVKHNKDQKLRHVFTVISPQAQLQLQAEHEAGYNQWFDVIHNAISQAINHQQKTDRDCTPTPAKNDISSPSLTGSAHTGASVDLTSPSSVGMSANGFSGNHTHDDDMSVSDGATVAMAGSRVDSPGPEAILASLRSVEGNTMCADCSSPDPEWLSLNLGILVCLECSGVHRALGVHTSKVRSTTMDSIDPNALEFMRAIGNRLANSVWEEELYNPVNAGFPKCTPLSSRPLREQYIRLKYEAKKFVNLDKSLPSLNITALGNEKEVRAMQMQFMSSLSTATIQRKKFSLTQQMFEAIQDNNIASLYRAMCWGCDPLWSTAENEGRNAAHQAVMYANIPAAVCVMYNCADRGLYSKEDRGWTVLHYAAYQNSPSMIELCLTFGGSKLTAEKDNEGRTPEDIVNTMNIGESFEKDRPEVLKLLHAAMAKHKARIAREEMLNKM